jgi:hypothetical protein
MNYIMPKIPRFRGLDKFMLVKDQYNSWVNQFTHHPPAKYEPIPRVDQECNDLGERLSRHNVYEQDKTKGK